MKKTKRRKTKITCNSIRAPQRGPKLSLIPIFLWFLSSATTTAAMQAEDEKEIAYASEAAPQHITDNASFMTFDEGQFNYLKKGSNNFTCLVVRDPNGRYEPSCFNQQAMRSVFYAYQMHMRLLYEGYSYDETYQRLKQAHETGELPTAETGSLVYMMSPNNKTYDVEKGTLRPTPIHQMYFYPKISDDTFSLSDGPPYLWQGFPHLSALIVVLD